MCDLFLEPQHPVQQPQSTTWGGGLATRSRMTCLSHKGKGDTEAALLGSVVKDTVTMTSWTCSVVSQQTKLVPVLRSKTHLLIDLFVNILLGESCVPTN